MRMLVAWYPDWPVIAAGCSPEIPAAVVRANQVVAVTAAGRVEGYGRVCGAGRPRAAARSWRSSPPMPAGMPGRGSRWWWPSRR